MTGIGQLPIALSDLKTGTEYFHIIRIEYTCIFLYLMIVGIGLELSRLMTDDRHRTIAYRLVRSEDGHGILPYYKDRVHLYISLSHDSRDRSGTEPSHD